MLSLHNTGLAVTEKSTTGHKLDVCAACHEDFFEPGGSVARMDGRPVFAE